MGLYDRDYVRGRQGGSFLGGDRTMVTTLIIANVAVFLLDVFARGQLSDMLALQADMPTHPWQIYQLLTYGFAHDPQSMVHIVGNMFGLWLFGRDVEAIYGRREFLYFYLTTIVGCGLVWLGVQWLPVIKGRPLPYGSMLGASGAVMAVMVLYILHYPQRMFLFMFFLPVPAWALGAFLIGADAIDLVRTQLGYPSFMQRLLGLPPTPIAYEVHLAGAAIAYFYCTSNWRWERLLGDGFRWPKFGRSRLRVHEPENEPPPNLSQRVDEILAKISEQGEASLSREERRILEDASRRYQRRKE
jgi:membrane associated rhomboid family serine protease